MSARSSPRSSLTGADEDIVDDDVPNDIVAGSVIVVGTGAVADTDVIPGSRTSSVPAQPASTTTEASTAAMSLI
jgi:hypothetical protein